MSLAIVTCPVPDALRTEKRARATMRRYLLRKSAEAHATHLLKRQIEDLKAASDSADIQLPDARDDCDIPAMAVDDVFPDTYENDATPDEFASSYHISDGVMCSCGDIECREEIVPRSLFGDEVISAPDTKTPDVKTPCIVRRSNRKRKRFVLSTRKSKETYCYFSGNLVNISHTAGVFPTKRIKLGESDARDRMIVVQYGTSKAAALHLEQSC